MTFDLRQEQIEQFGRDGVTCIRQPFPGYRTEALATRLDEIMRRENEGIGSATSRNFVSGFCMWMKDPLIATFAQDSSAAQAAAKLLNSRKINLYCDHLFIKEVGDIDKKTPWHCDLPYWTLSGSQVLSFWIALDRVTASSGGLRYIKGSHKWDHSWIDGEQFESNADEIQHFPSCEYLEYDLMPGDILAHHGFTYHGANGNLTNDRRRRGYAIRYAGDDVRFEPRQRFSIPGTTGMAAGSALDSESFPVLFQSQGPSEEVIGAL